jgi:hypothetical protein
MNNFFLKSICQAFVGPAEARVKRGTTLSFIDAPAGGLLDTGTIFQNQFVRPQGVSGQSASLSAPYRRARRLERSRAPLNPKPKIKT